MTGSNDEFRQLVAEFPPRPPRSPEDARALDARISELLSAEHLSPAANDYLELLSDLLRAWEDKNESIPDVSGVEMMRFLLEMSGRRQKDLIEIFGTESIVSEVLAGRRNLQRKHIQGLSQLFGVSPSAFFPRVPTKEPMSPAAAADTAPAGPLRRMSIVVDDWAPAAVSVAQTLHLLDIKVLRPEESSREAAISARGTLDVVLFTTRTASAAQLRLQEIGRVVVLDAHNVGAATQAKLFQAVSYLLAFWSTAGPPSHQRIDIQRESIEVHSQNTGSATHIQTIPVAAS